MGPSHGLERTSNLRILLVDDERSYIEVLSIGLSGEYDYQISMATSGEEAIRILSDKSQMFDVILLDYRMPEMDGLQVLEWINAQKIRIPVVMLTGAGSESIAVEAMKLGAYDYARKESTDLLLLHNLIEATHERYVFRVSKQYDEERVRREIQLSREAIDATQHAINLLTPVLNSAFPHLGVLLESLHSLLRKAKAGEGEALVREIKEAMKTLEIAMRSFLELSQHLYARHEDIEEIKKVITEFKSRMNDLKR